MFDCLDTFSHTTHYTGSTTTTTATSIALASAKDVARRHAGRSWVRFQAREANQTELAKVREVALYLNASIEKLDDSSLLLLDLSLSQILALSERFGGSLAIEAQIATQAQH